MVNPKRWIGLVSVLLCVATAPAARPIESRIATAYLALPQPLEPNAASWCTWSRCFLGPRLDLAPRSDRTFLVGWTDAAGNGHESVVVGSSINALTHSRAAACTVSSPTPTAPMPCCSNRA